MVLNATKPSLPYGWPVSERVKHEVVKQDVWSVFSPAGGFVPKVSKSHRALHASYRLIINLLCQDSINLGQGFMNWSPREDSHIEPLYGTPISLSERVIFP